VHINLLLYIKRLRWTYKAWYDVIHDVKCVCLYLLQEFQIYSPWVYLHHIEGLRPDVLIVDLLLARNSWYLDYLAKVSSLTGPPSRLDGKDES